MDPEDVELRETMLAISIVEIYPGTIDDNPQQPIEATWEVTEANMNNFEIQLYFKEPLEVSNNAAISYHAVQIAILQEEYFQSL